MKILVVGLGSMGKRRVRCLQALGIKEIAGFDLRKDRCDEARKKYGIKIYDQYSGILEKFEPAAVIISTPPKQHMQYAWDACEKGIHCFIEASVVGSDQIMDLYRFSQEKGVVMAPSCTMGYFPGPKTIKKLVNSEAIGRPLNLNYQVGQYLPDWHPWENIQEFYVSDRETGGCREIVPFELTWLNDVFGHPKPLSCTRTKLTDINADIDDIYHCLLRYPNNFIVNLTVEVISRPIATREFRLLGSEGEIVMSADEKSVRFIKVGENKWDEIPTSGGTVEKNYIYPEEPYIDEIKDFISAVKDKDQSRFPNDLSKDFDVLQTLYGLEQCAVELP